MLLQVSPSLIKAINVFLLFELQPKKKLVCLPFTSTPLQITTINHNNNNHHHNNNNNEDDITMIPNWIL